jgi:hypothetical protein
MASRAALARAGKLGVVPPATRRVLYVDDNPLLTGLVERIFAADPTVAVQTAPDGAASAWLLRSSRISSCSTCTSQT